MFASAGTYIFASNTTNNDVVVTDTGNLGVGTTNPLYRLHVSGTAGFESTLYAPNIGTGTDNSVVVCTLTGHGLKDPDVAIRQSPEPISIPKGGEGLRDLILSSID